MREASDRWGLDVTEFASLVFPEGRSKIMEETKKLTAARISKGHIGERISKYERNTLRDQQAREVLGQRTNHRSLTRGRLSPNPHLHKDSKGMSEEEKEDSMPLWMKHKLAIKEKLLGKAWIPQKRISRQAMEEVRYLRKQFPEEWTTDKLAKHFNISSESVRRILRTDFQLSPERVAEQDEAKERMRKEKVAAALERLKTERHARWLEIKAERRQMRLSRNPPVEGRIKLGAPKRSIINE
ncbi:Neugrin-domain-containing protein [Lobosporangium transversale]|uniref:Required for respiratory growth protein 9, mitochondrial n=1 Tax=Lobosporangium transversale TaxID=64571 RepID=A0A1Y2H569_9FUNG|nr:Neugrin-domain-containing protein [Lobosporangium transversale]ORZ28182.1 Neugrin-domain-containing protein [Lobosporangium transversale]|eukprot:XP_021885867.1 Neugrin-domain-containing protein [Lobosporangium transversale]